MTLDAAYNRGNIINQVSGIPVIVKQTAGYGSPFGYSPENILDNASLVAIQNAVDAAMTVLGPGSFYIKGSGTQGYLLMQVGTALPFLPAVSAINASGVLIVSANGGLVLNQNGGEGPVLIENKGDGHGHGGQLVLSAFNGSGQLEYGMGPGSCEGWYARNSHNELDLIPTSGQVSKIVVDILKRFDLI